MELKIDLSKFSNKLNDLVRKLMVIAAVYLLIVLAFIATLYLLDKALPEHEVIVEENSVILDGAGLPMCTADSTDEECLEGAIRESDL